MEPAKLAVASSEPRLILKRRSDLEICRMFGLLAMSSGHPVDAATVRRSMLRHSLQSNAVIIQ